MSNTGNQIDTRILKSMLNKPGTLLIGDDSIINARAGFTYRAARLNASQPDIDQSKIISLTAEAVDIPGDAAQLRKMPDEVRRAGNTCEWSLSTMSIRRKYTYINELSTKL